MTQDRGGQLQNPIRRIGAGLFASVTLLVVAWAVYESLDPDNYFSQFMDPRIEWEFPALHVVLFCLAMIVEALVVYVVFVAHWPEVLWGRCLLGLSFLSPVALLFSLLVVHSPPYMIIHVFWVWLLIIILVAVALASALAALASATKQQYTRLR